VSPRAMREIPSRLQVLSRAVFMSYGGGANGRPC
jgi:hypothetical protein